MFFEMREESETLGHHSYESNLKEHCRTKFQCCFLVKTNVEIEISTLAHSYNIPDDPLRRYKMYL